MGHIPGPCLNIKIVFPGMGIPIIKIRGRLNIKMSYHYRIPMLKIRRSCDHLIFNMGIFIPGKDGAQMVMGPYLYNGNIYTGRTISLY